MHLIIDDALIETYLVVHFKYVRVSVPLVIHHALQLFFYSRIFSLLKLFLLPEKNRACLFLMSKLLLF